MSDMAAILDKTFENAGYMTRKALQARIEGQKEGKEEGKREIART